MPSIHWLSDFRLRRPRRAALAVGLLAFGMAGVVDAEPGVQADTVTFGMIAGLSGPAGGPAKTAVTTIRAYFSALNTNGGVNGRKLLLVDADDAAEPQQARSALGNLEDRQAVIGYLLARSGPVIDAIMPMLDSGKIPLLGAVGGSREIYEGSHRTVFLLRPSFSRETEEACRLAGMLGIKSMISVAPQNSAGDEMIQGVQTAVAKGYLEQSTSIRYDAETLDAAKLAQQILEKKPTAVLVGGLPKPVASIIAAAKKLGVDAWFLTQSNNSSSDFIKALGADPTQVIVSQVFPSPRSSNIPLALDFQRLAKSANLPTDYAAFEAYITARIAVEALRQTGRKPTRAGFVDGLTGLSSLDLGGLLVSFGRDRRVGNTFVELTLLNKDAQFVR